MTSPADPTTSPPIERVAKRGLVIAIDGPAGSGKSTLARRLAGHYGLPWINTGVMYRALAAWALATGVSADDEGRLEEGARALRFAVGAGGEKVPPGQLLVEGRLPGPELLTPEVEATVSAVARHPRVRAVLRDRQRGLGAGGSVMEGRDIGSVVFPDADAKIFLSAAQDVRISRRESERGANPAVDRAVVRRDALDARTNPFEPAVGAHTLDSTHLTPDEMFELAVRIVDAERAAAGEDRGEGSGG